MNAESFHRTVGPKHLQNAVGILFDVVVIGALFLLVCMLTMDPLLGTLTRLWWKGQEDQFVTGWKSVDTVVHQAADGSSSSNQNTALSVSTLNPDSADHVAYSDAMLMRGGYTLYPRLIWAAPEGTLLNGGPNAITARFHPSLEWLRAHNVRSVLEGTPDSSGKVVTSILLLPGATDQK